MKGGFFVSNGNTSYNRYLGGDESAFDELLREMRPRLTYFINGYIKDVHIAEDICIDVFVYLLANPSRFNPDSSLSTYLFMLARSRAIDYLRHKKVRRETELCEAEGVADTSEPFSALLDSERKLTLHSALMTLPDDMRSAVYLVYFEELSYKDAARVMGVSTKKIDNLLYRAKAILREKLSEEVELLL